MESFVLVELNADGSIKKIVRTHSESKRGREDETLLSEATDNRYDLITVEHID